ncbi:protein EDS1L-like isoform X1 [Dioscorea cayenensis subsp. rotundata]|uniref:Protein EDS1L-like isoform X1 n=1 Tax=Dioscorea cayennensis subsp. rotundata TaxID=55577 RepID=A0AB40BT68_DIOCR|nr:protein EDS1L-like isoform X1 [Dioscorea cayenensis subsp. rotundata]
MPISAAASMDKVLLHHCVSLSMKAHHSSTSPFLLHSLSVPSPCSIFAFAGSWSADDWIVGDHAPFGASDIDSLLFPSLKTLVRDVPAAVNMAFLRSFQMILEASRLQAEVLKAVAERKQIVFTGHSSGGAISVLAAIWLLEKHLKTDNGNHNVPFCITFGSPLIGDNLFCQALQREDWSSCFLHFVMTMDIVPRIPLAPLASLKEELHSILQFLCPKSSCLSSNSFEISQLLSRFYFTVLRNALTISNHQSCLSMGCATSLLGNLSGFIKFSPYKPFGTYVFCCNNGRLVSVKNSDAILQMLFYCLREEKADDPYRSFKEHLQYESKLKSYLEAQNVVHGDYLQANELFSSEMNPDEMPLVETFLNDLDMGKEAWLHLHAAAEWEMQKFRNQKGIDANYSKIQEALNALDNYRSMCELRGLCYYDAFKLQRDTEDFNANVKRLELAGLWDEIIEMLSRFELPDRFEGRNEWVKLGTRYCLLVEPLDIANYYRHSKNEDTGPYMVKGRPRRYKFTQRWGEHAQRMPKGSSLESCFWAMVEEISADMNNKKPFVEVKERVLELEKNVSAWLDSGKLGSDVLLGGSTFVKWWMALPKQHKLSSCIARIMSRVEKSG